MIEPLKLGSFARGRVTAINHAEIPTDAMLVAKNIILQGGAPRRIPGYQKITDTGLDTVRRMFSFERQSDKQQFLMATGGAKIAKCSINGAFAAVNMSTTETSDDFDFLQTSYALFLNNAVKQYKMINVSGNDVLVPWGLYPPVSTPTIAIGGGTLTLTYGTRYVYCEVFTWIDSVGVTRTHVSPMSDLSAHTGPLAANAVTVANLAAVNANTTHFWIFRVQDSIVGGSGDYYFVAEVPVVVTTFTDSIDDSLLDTTRKATLDNQPPPASNIMLDYNGRAVLMADDFIQLSALDEVVLGIPYECFPPYLRYRVPSGVKKLTAGIIFQSSLFSSTEDYWFILNGTNTDNFQTKDQVVKPGAIGRKLALIVRGKLVWLGKDKKLWSWTGIIGDDAVPASSALHAPGVDKQFSMDDLSTDFLSQCELLEFSNGIFDIVVLVAASKNTEHGEKDWLQVWDLSPITGVLTIQGPIPAPSETDFFPYDYFSTSLVAKDNGIQYVYFGSLIDGEVFRWPDGLNFNGNPINNAVVGTPWVQVAERKAKLKKAMLFTNVINAKDQFHFACVASKGVQSGLLPVQVDLEDDREADLLDPTVAAAHLSHERGAAYGNWLKMWVTYPGDDIDCALDRIEVEFVPLE